MKKLLFISMIVFAFQISAFANVFDNATNNIATLTQEQTVVTGDFFEILPNIIGANLVIYISDMDTIIRGSLQNVYNDGIVVKTIFNQTVFISKKSISYFEIKNANLLDF